MLIRKTTNPEAFERDANAFLSGAEGLVAHVCMEPCVWTGQLATIRRDECEKRGLFVGVGQYLGGTIVNMPGDLSLCLTTWGSSEWAPECVARMAELVAQRGATVTTDENDVLADGKKVLSWARATTVKGWCQSVVHCSVGRMDIALVEAICDKPMVKTPGQLCDYGITAEELLKVALEALDYLEERKDENQ